MTTAAPAPVTANPYLDQYTNQLNMWGGDSTAAVTGQNPATLNTLQQQQTQVNGDGGFGYVAGSGNDMSGSSYAQSNPWAVAGSNQGQNPYQDSLQNQGTGIGAMTPNNDVQSGAANPYPTYANSYGLGTQTGTSAASNGTDGGSLGAGGSGTPGSSASAFQAITPKPQSDNPYAGDAQAYYPQNSGPQPSSTTGFNPWSMTGEANSRIM